MITGGSAGNDAPDHRRGVRVSGGVVLVSEWQVIQGDCLDVLRSMPDASVDAVITDPPYALGFDYASYDDTRENLQRTINGVMPELRRVSSRVYVMPGQTQMYMYPEPDWVLSVVWNTTGTFGKYGFSQWMPVLAYGKDIKGFGSVNGGVLKGDVLRISGGAGVGFMRGDEKKNHPCPKPVNVMRLLTDRLTFPDSTVLDPFCGSGTTGIACVQTGRRFIGIEIDPGYCELARRRIADAVPLTAEVAT